MLTKDRGTAIVAGCFVVALAVAATLLFTRSGESAPLEWTRGAAVPTSLPLGRTVVDDNVPVAVVPGIQAWTGSQLLILGVDARGTHNVGAVYEPATGRWHEMSALPFRTALRAPGGVWTGTTWVVVGTLCRANPPPCDGALAAATYDPGTDTWSPVDENPQPAAGNGRGHPASFGRGIGMLGSDAAFLVDGQYYAFRVDTRDWDWLPQPAAADPVACSANGTLAAYNADSTVSLLAPGANAWTVGGPKAPPSPLPRSSVCTTSDVLAYAADLTSVARFDVGAGRWRDVTPPPALRPAGPVTGGSTGRSALFWQPSATIAYDADTTQWRAAPAGLTVAPGRVSWTQFGYGLYVSDEHTLDAYNPGG